MMVIRMSDRLEYLRHKLDLNKNNTVSVIRKDDLKWAVEETERLRTENERLQSFKDKAIGIYNEHSTPHKHLGFGLKTTLEFADQEIKAIKGEISNESTNQD